MKLLLSSLPIILLAGCMPSEIALPQGSAALGDPAQVVPAEIETLVTMDPQVDADDPALWADPRDPSRAVIFATDKSDGLYVHDMDGKVRQFLPDGPLNNVDLRTGFVVNGKEYVLVAATERNIFGIATYLFDPDTFETRPYGFIATGPEFGEPYGFCTAKIDGQFYLIPNNKDGDIRIYRLETEVATATATLERSLKVGSQPEGCVADDKAKRLYVGEEDIAIWRFDLGPDAGSDPVMVAPVDGKRLAADVEGLTIMRDRGTDYLVASSQGDATYPVWRIDNDSYHYAGRFAVEGGAIDAVTGTDGLDAWSGPIGPFSEGAIAMHDTDDGAGQQNYKVVDWRKVREALSLP